MQFGLKLAQQRKMLRYIRGQHHRDNVFSHVPVLLLRQALQYVELGVADDVEEAGQVVVFQN